MKILFFGDIVGKKGREVVIDNLFMLKEKYHPDLIIANSENSAHGKGITYKIYNQLRAAGIDVITLGNHAYSKEDIVSNMTLADRLVCPYNHELTTIDCQTYLTLIINNKKVCITNLMCEALMNQVNISPFKAMDEILSKTNADLYIVDLHGEATAEKRLFAEYYKSKLTAVLGTHTHVQTADERIIGNLAFISDVGMCGPYDSIIGRDINECIESKIKGNQMRYAVSDSEGLLNAVVIDVDDTKLMATNIERIQIRPY